MSSEVDITQHKGLAHLIAKRYRWATASPAIDEEDLVQTAFEGLARASKTYRAELSGFGYYGGQWAKAYTRREICKAATVIVVGPRQRAEMAETGEDELLTHMVRLDADVNSVGAHSRSLHYHEVVPSDCATPEDDTESSEAAAAVQAAYARLKPRFRLVLRLRIVEEWTLAAVGKRLGISREGARQVIERAKEALRAELLRGA